MSILSQPAKPVVKEENIDSSNQCNNRPIINGNSMLKYKTRSDIDESSAILKKENNGSSNHVESIEQNNNSLTKKKIENNDETDKSNSIETTKQPAPKKRKKTSNNLAKLLEDSMWYIESSGGSKVRESSLKIEKLKEQQIDELIHDSSINKIEVPELTPEEIAEQERRKKIRGEKAKLYHLMKKEKKKRRSEAIKKNRNKNQGEKAEKRPKKVFDLNNIDYDSYYGGGEIAELLKASQYFTNQGKKFDSSNRREIKPVERLSQDYEYSSSLSRKTHGKKLKHRDNKIEKNKSTPKRKYKKRARKEYEEYEENEEEEEENHEDEENLDQNEGNNNDNQSREGTTESDDSKQENDPPSEPEPIWFTDFLNNDIDISTNDWKFFQDFIYEQKNDDFIPTNLVHGADLIRNTIKIYRTDHEVYKLQKVELHFPFSNYKEQYLLALPKDDIQYNPFDEIGKLMELMSNAFFPPEEKNKVMNLDDSENCIVGRYINSFEKNDIDELIKCINEFNQLIDSLRINGKILEFTKERKTFPREFIYELLNQCYLRKILPESKKLSNYKAFSNEVYGELMPSFLTTVYSKCELNNKCCFIDLGSGVGNCVIQAAIEFGCESHGVEIVANASRLGDLQLEEFENRCRIFGLKPGFVNLFSKQSFVNNPPVKEIVDRCQVILVNNYLFDTQLNKKVVELFQDLKVGTKIISLKPIVPATHTIDWDNCSSILNRLKTSKFIYDEDSVSWTSKGGFYYITEVMNDIVEDNFVVFKSREARRRDEGLDERSRSDTPLNAFTNNV